MKKFCAVLTFLVFCAAAGWGVDYTWTGAGGTDALTDSGNWASAAPNFLTTPTTGDTLTINRTGTHDFKATSDFDIGSITVINGIFTTVANTTITALTTILDGGNLDTSGTTTGTVDLGSLSITPTGGTLTLAGTEILTPIGSMGGTVVFTGSAPNLKGITEFNNLTISGGAHAIVVATTVNGDFSMSGGGLTINTGQTLTLKGTDADFSGGTLTATGSTVILDGAGGTIAMNGTDSLYDLQVTDGIWTAGSAITVDNELRVGDAMGAGLTAGLTLSGGSSANSVTITGDGVLDLNQNVLSITTSVFTNTGRLRLYGNEAIMPSQYGSPVPGEVEYNGAGPGLSGLTDFTDVLISNGTHAIAADTTVNGTLTIGASGDLDLNGQTLTLKGVSADFSGGGTLTAGGSSTLILDGPTSLNTGGATVNELTIQNGNVVLGSNLTVGTLNIATLLDLNGSDLTVTGATGGTPGLGFAGTLRIRNNEAVNGATNPIADFTGGTVEYYNTGPGTPGVPTGRTYTNLTFSNAASGPGNELTWQAGGGLTVSGTLTINTNTVLDMMNSWNFTPSTPSVTGGGTLTGLALTNPIPTGIAYGDLVLGTGAYETSGTASLQFDSITIPSGSSLDTVSKTLGGVGVGVAVIQNGTGVNYIGGNITATNGITLAGTTTLTGNVTLAASGGAISLADVTGGSNNLTLNSLNLSSSGFVSTTGIVSVAVTGGSGITLNNPSNAIGTFTANAGGGNITLVNSADLILENVNAATVNVSLTGNDAVTQAVTTAITAGTLILGGSSAGFVLDKNNDIVTLQTDTAAYPESITFVDANSFSLAANFHAGTIDLIAGTTITIVADLQADTSVSFTTNGTITMSDNITTPTLTLGSLNTNLVLNGKNISGPTISTDIVNNGTITFITGSESLGTAGVTSVGGTAVFFDGTAFADIRTFNNLTLNGTSTHVVDNNTGDIAVTGTLTIGPLGGLTLDVNSLTTTNFVANSGIITFTNGTESLGSTITDVDGTVVFLGGTTTLAGITGFNNLELHAGTHSPAVGITATGELKIGDGLPGDARLNLGDDSDVYDLTINIDGTLDFKGHNLAVTTVTNNGTIRLLGSETLTPSAQFNNTGSGKIEYYGTVGPLTLCGITEFYNVEITSGGIHDAGAAITVGTGTAGILAISNGTLNLAAALSVVNGNISLGNGSDFGTLAVPDSGSLTVARNVTERTLGQGIVTLADNSAMTVGGDWDVTDLTAHAGSKVTFTGGNADIITHNNGFGNIEVNASSGATKTVTGEINTWSDLTVTAGTLQSEASMTNTIGGNLLVNGGTLNFLADNDTDIDGDLTVSSGILTFSTGNSTDIDGDLTVSSGILTFSTGNSTDIGGNLTVSGGTLNFSTGNLTANVAGYAEVSGGSLTLNGTTTITGSNGGTGYMALSSNGTVTIPNNSTVTVTNAVTMSDTATLVGPTGASELGTLNASSISQIAGAGNKITGNLTINTTSGINLGGSNAAGTLTLINGSGGIVFNNTVAVTLNSVTTTTGDILITAGGSITLPNNGDITTSGGSITIECDNLIDLTGGGHAVTAGTTVTVKPSTVPKDIHIGDTGMGLVIPAALMRAINAPSGLTIGDINNTGDFYIGNAGDSGDSGIVNGATPYDLLLQGSSTSSNMTFQHSAVNYSLQMRSKHLDIRIGGSITHGGSGTNDITSTSPGTLKIVAGSVGTSTANRLPVSVEILDTSDIGTSMYLSNSVTLIIRGTIAAGGTIDILDTATSGGITQAINGTGIIRSSTVVLATDTGNITQNANASIEGTSSVSITATTGSVIQNTNASIAGDNSVSINASGGNITQYSSASITQSSTGGSVVLSASGSIEQTGASISGAAPVSLTAATGNITQNANASITGADSVSITATTGSVTQTVDTAAIIGDEVTVNANTGINLIGHNAFAPDNMVNTLHLSNTGTNGITYIGDARSGPTGTITLDARNTVSGGTVNVTAKLGNIAVASDSTHGIGPVISSSNGAISITADTGDISTNSNSSSTNPAIISNGGSITLLSSASTGTGTITVDSAAGTDAIVSAGGDIVLNGGTDAGKITLLKNIKSGVSGGGGDIDFYKPVVIGDSLTVDSFDGVSTKGNINFHDTIEPAASGAYNLTLIAGPGNIELNGIIEAGGNRIGDLTITSAADVTLNYTSAVKGPVYLAGSFEIHHSGVFTQKGANPVGAGTDENGSNIYTGGSFTQASPVLTATNSIAANISAGDGGISFDRSISLDQVSGTVSMTATGTTGGNITIGTAINPADSTVKKGQGEALELTAAGTGTRTIEINSVIGERGTAPIGSLSASADKVIVNSEVTANDITITATNATAGLVINAPAVTPAPPPGGDVLASNRLTVNGITENNGIITAGTGTEPESGSPRRVAILFNGDYSGAGYLNGNIGGNPEPETVFAGARIDLRNYTHNDDWIVFSGELWAVGGSPLPQTLNILVDLPPSPGIFSHLGNVLLFNSKNLTLDPSSNNIVQDTSTNNPVLEIAAGILDPNGKYWTMGTRNPLPADPEIFIGRTGTLRFSGAAPSQNVTGGEKKQILVRGDMLLQGSSGTFKVESVMSTPSSPPADIPDYNQTAWISLIDGSASIGPDVSFNDNPVDKPWDITLNFQAHSLPLVYLDAPVPIGALAFSRVNGGSIAESVLGFLSDVHFRGSVTIEEGRTIDPAPVPPSDDYLTIGGIQYFYNRTIIVNGSWINNRTDAKPGFRSMNQNGDYDGDQGVREGRRSRVIFRGKKTYIVGNSDWWIFEAVADEIPGFNGMMFFFSPFQNNLTGPFHKIEYLFRVLGPDGAPPVIFPVDPDPDQGVTGQSLDSASYRGEWITLSKIWTFTNPEPWGHTHNLYEDYDPPDMTKWNLWPSREKFWDFDLQNGARMDINRVRIFYSHSTRRIPVPGPNDPDGRIVQADSDQGLYHESASPQFWEGYFDVNWIRMDSFYYSFTEDANRNGRIDRIRIQAAYELMGDAGAFSEFDLEIEDYEIDASRGFRGYERVETMPNHDGIYVYLKEKDYNDTGATLKWKVIKNNSLFETISGSTRIGRVNEIGETIDTVPPRINYALALPQRNQIFLQLSEPLVSIAGKDMFFSFMRLSDSLATRLRTNQVSKVSDTEYLLHLDDPLSLEDLATGNAGFSISDAADLAMRAYDVNNFYPDTPMYPSPTYPVNWDYTEYKPVLYEDRPPGVMIPQNRFFDGDAGDSNHGQRHRATDMLISLPPASANDDKYFVWPVWARDNETARPETSDFWSAQGTDFGLVWEFSGRGILQHRDITVQARLNPAFSIQTAGNTYGNYSMELYYTNPLDEFRSRDVHGPIGFWLPSFRPEWVYNETAKTYDTRTAYSNMVPWPHMSLYGAHDTGVSTGQAVDNNRILFNFGLNKELYQDRKYLDFFFLFRDPSNGASPMYAGRLDIPRGAEVPVDWYRRVKPFTVEVHSTTIQRGGVTILNNVINPTRGEQVYVNYNMTRSGRVTIQVFTLDGNLVRSLRRENRPAGEYREAWDGTNKGGRPVARGMYFIRVVGPDIDEIRKVMVVK